MSLAQDASSMIRGFGFIWARSERGRLSMRRGSNFASIHSNSIRSQKKPRRLSMRFSAVHRPAMQTVENMTLAVLASCRASLRHRSAQSSQGSGTSASVLARLPR